MSFDDVKLKIRPILKVCQSNLTGLFNRTITIIPNGCSSIADIFVIGSAIHSISLTANCGSPSRPFRHFFLSFPLVWFLSIPLR